MVDDYPKRLAESLLMEADAADAGAQAGIQGMHILGKKFRSAAETIAALEARCRQAEANESLIGGEIDRLDKRIAELEAALRKIIDEGDYTAPEGMKRIALTALETDVCTCPATMLDIFCPTHGTAANTQEEQPGSNPGHVAEHGRSLVGDAEESRSSSAHMNRSAKP